MVIRFLRRRSSTSQPNAVGYGDTDFIPSGSNHTLAGETDPLRRKDSVQKRDVFLTATRVSM